MKLESKNGKILNFKKSEQLEKQVSLKSLSILTGLPIHLLKEELLLDDSLQEEDQLQMDELIKALFTYLNKSMLT